MSQNQTHTMDTAHGHVDQTTGLFQRFFRIKKDEKPPKEILTFEQNLQELHLYEACQQLIEREERLYLEITETREPKHPKEDTEKLAADYSKFKDLVLQTLVQNLSLSPGEVNIYTLASAMKAIYQEEEQDQMWKQRDSPPPWRPCSLKKLHDSMVRSFVEGRMDKPSVSTVDQLDQSSLQEDIHTMGKQLKDDLLLLVGGLKRCYPPETDICNVYARVYHQTFSAKVRRLSDSDLEDKDCTFLLRWVNEYYPEILQKISLASEINIEALGRLLPKESLEPLEEQYLSQRQSELMTYISQVLKDAEQKWKNGEEVETEFGCYVSPVAYDITQLINGMVTSAEKVVGDLHKAQSITRQLNGLIQRFRSFQDDMIIKQNRPNSKAYVKANLSCVKQFRDVLVKNSHLFPKEVQENCLCLLTDMKQSAHVYLLNHVHKALKPQYRKLGTDDWLNKSVLDNLLVSIKTEIQDLKGLTEACHQELICQFHQEVLAEYVKRLLKGDVKLKDKDQQHQAYVVMKDNAESLHSLFREMGSKEAWLKEILTKIAEVLKLQDVPAIQMQVVSLGTTFPDLREKHLSALLKLKPNLSKADRKAIKGTLRDALRDVEVTDAFPFFSKVQIK